MRYQTPPLALPARSAAAVIGLTMLRVTIGIVMVVHGIQKASEFSAWEAQVSSLGLPLPPLSAALGVAGELLGGTGLAVGFLTSLAAFGVACTMAIATFFVHWEAGLLAQNGGFEYPLVLMMAALFFVLRGPGPLSLDALLRHRLSVVPAPAASPRRAAPMSRVSTPPGAESL